MRHASPNDFRPPVQAGLADLTTPERMAIVMRRSGESTTRQDFLRAPETCDLTVDQLEANLGAAARIVEAATERQVGPCRPVHPWEVDPDYRRERVKHAGALVAGMLADDAAVFAALRHANFDATEIGALWSEIVGEAADLFRQLRAAPMVRIVADLAKALDAFERQSIFQLPAMAQLAVSMRVVLSALDDQTELPRTNVLQTVKAFIKVLDESNLDPAIVEAARSAHATLRTLWGL